MNIPRIKIQYEYEHNVVLVDFESYKPISIIYEKAETLFFPLNLDKQNKMITYNSKDLNGNKLNPLGEIFRNKRRVTVKIVNKNLIVSSNKSPNKKTITEYYRPEDDYLVTRKINVQEKENSNSQEKHLSSVNKICSCNNNELVSFYCRKCKEFICKLCRFSKSHLNHKTILFDINKPFFLEDSLRLYCTNIKADAALCSKAISGYHKLAKEIKILDFTQQKKKLLKKIEEFDANIKLLTESLPKIENETQVLNEIDQKNEKLNAEISKVLKEVEKIKNWKMEVKQPSKEEKEKYDNSTMDLLEEVSLMEFEIENLSQRSLSLKLNYDIHEKITEMYENIEQCLNKNVFNEEYKFQIKYTDKELEKVPSEITNIIRQTANSKGNPASTSIQNLIHFSQTIKKEMDESRKKIENTKLSKNANKTTYSIEKLEKELKEIK